MSSVGVNTGGENRCPPRVTHVDVWVAVPLNVAPVCSSSMIPVPTHRPTVIGPSGCTPKNSSANASGTCSTTSSRQLQVPPTSTGCDALAALASSVASGSVGATAPPSWQAAAASAASVGSTRCTRMDQSP